MHRVPADGGGLSLITYYWPLLFRARIKAHDDMDGVLAECQCDRRTDGRPVRGQTVAEYMRVFNGIHV